MKIKQKPLITTIIIMLLGGVYITLMVYHPITILIITGCILFGLLMVVVSMAVYNAVDDWFD